MRIFLFFLFKDKNTKLVIELGINFIGQKFFILRRIKMGGK